MDWRDTGRHDQVMKMDCRANGELIWRVRKPLQPHFCEMSSPLIEMDRNKKMACAVESLRPRTTNKNYPMLPTTTTKGKIMLNEQTFDKLYAMKLIGMSEGFKEQLEQSSFRDLSFEERFALLVDRQWLWKENKRLKRLLQAPNSNSRPPWKTSTTEPREESKNPSSSASPPVSGSAVTRIFSSPVLQEWAKPSSPVPLPRRPVGKASVPSTFAPPSSSTRSLWPEGMAATAL